MYNIIISTCFLALIQAGCVKSWTSKKSLDIQFKCEINGIKYIDKPPVISATPGAQFTPYLGYVFNDKIKAASFKSDLRLDKSNSQPEYTLAIDLPIDSLLAANKKYVIGGDASQNYSTLPGYIFDDGEKMSWDYRDRKIPYCMIGTMNNIHYGYAFGKGYIEFTEIGQRVDNIFHDTTKYAKGNVDIQIASPLKSDGGKVLNIKGEFTCKIRPN